MATTVTVIGAGAWGTTLAGLLADKGTSVCLWAREQAVVDTITTSHENTLFLPGIALSPALRATTSMPEALADADLLLLAVPSRWMRTVCREMRGYLPNAVPPVLTVTKGLEIETGARMSEIIRAELPALPAIAALSGPNLAPEIAQGQPAATVVASEHLALAAQVQELLMTANFRPYTSVDMVGVEVCGAVKNVIAIGMGICEGMGYGDNAKAALLTRAVAEISRLVLCLGGQAETVAGLSGTGDLIATCFSPMSRNHRVGLALGRGQRAADALGGSGQVAEGVPTTEAVIRLARRLGVEMPISEQVYAILFDGRTPTKAVHALMTRMRRSE